ncbi:MAG: helix-turn-helix transcriptional regulator [Clostridia bacterium]|nr:helix-turn-helix transcriptional regulator [Clostridia bacterium]
MKNNLKVFADNICKYRNELNKSQTQFATYISRELMKYGIDTDYSNKSISKWESAESIPSVEVLIALSKIMNVSIDDLVKGQIDMRVVQSVDKDELVKKLKSFPEVTYLMFGDKELCSSDYGILGKMVRSIVDYYDKNEIKGDADDLEEMDINLGAKTISCPYAVAFYDNDNIKDLEYLTEDLVHHVEFDDDFVEDVNNRSFNLYLKRRKKGRYTFKNTNMHRFCMSDNTIGAPQGVLNDYKVNNYDEFKKAFQEKLCEVKEKCQKFEESGLISELSIDFGVDFENRLIMFYLTGSLNLNDDELRTVWSGIGIQKYYNTMSTVSKRTAKNYYQEMADIY